MIQIPVEPQITEFLHSKASRLGIPLSGTFELTPCCNMACKMCYVRMTRSEQEAIRPLRSAAEWIELGRQAKEQGMLYLLLTGGEPFLRPDFREILQGLHRQGLIISINSNGTLIDEETVAWLKQSPPTRINITLYGGSDATYDRLCGNPRGFTQVTRAIELLQEAGISIKLNCSLTPHNAEDLEAIFAFAREHHLLVQATSYMFPPVRRDAGMVGMNERFTPEEAAYQAARIVCQLNGEDAFLRYMEEEELPPIPLDPNEDCPELGEGIRCRAGKCSFWVTWEGKLLPCGMMPVKGGINVFDGPFLEGWTQIRQNVQQIRLPGACAKCPAKARCKACAAMVYTETGDFHKVPQYRCDMTKAYPEACRQLEREIRARRAEEHHE